MLFLHSLDATHCLKSCAVLGGMIEICHSNKLTKLETRQNYSTWVIYYVLFYLSCQQV